MTASASPATSATSRRATVTWEGSLATGSGTVSASTSGVFGDLPVSWPSRIGEADGRTSPEELLAAAHAACFAMAFASRLTKAGSPPERLEVTATVSLEERDGARRVGSSALEARVRAPGVDENTIRELGDDAKAKCPISQALTGNVELSVAISVET